MPRKQHYSSIPSYDELMMPTVKALISLGGSGTNGEINNKVYEITNLSEEVLQIPHGKEGAVSEIYYRLAWSRTHLKNIGIIENSSRGVWVISTNINVAELSNDEIIELITAAKKTSISQIEQPRQKQPQRRKSQATNGSETQKEWKSTLLELLYRISPAAFERLAQRLLRESEFSQVEVTGKVGDGGIDGKGIVKVGGLVSFRVIFQCKRYRGSVSPSQIRDFRGAMQGRADKGLFITTGRFTEEAKKEATRDGVPLIDLIDGDLLCEKMKELKLGIDTELIEVVNINHEWFDHL